MRLRVQAGDGLSQQFFQGRTDSAKDEQANRATGADGGNENIHAIPVRLFRSDDASLSDETPPGDRLDGLDGLHNPFCDVTVRRGRRRRFTASHQAKLPLYQPEERNLCKNGPAVSNQEGVNCRRFLAAGWPRSSFHVR
jgi:hypothetical protein